MWKTSLDSPRGERDSCVYDIGSIVSISEGAWKQVDGEEITR